MNYNAFDSYKYNLDEGFYPPVRLAMIIIGSLLSWVLCYGIFVLAGVLLGIL